MSKEGSLGEWSISGLQNHALRFDSERSLLLSCGVMVAHVVLVHIVEVRIFTRQHLFYENISLYLYR